MSATVHDVAVVGGGVVGAALALALRRAGLDVVLVERAAPPKAWDAADVDLRVYAMAPASSAFLDELGVWPRVRDQRASAYEAMQVWDDDATRALRFDASDVRAPQLGHIVENSLLLAELWRALGGVRTLSGCEVRSYLPLADSVLLELSDGSEVSARVAVAADGADSRLRTLAGIDVTGWDYEQAALVCHVRTAQPHRATAYQRFLPSGPLAFLPLADGRCSIVWSSTEATALLALDDATFRERLRAASQDQLGEILECTRRVSFPLRLMHAQRYTGERLALAGDAAHVIHPLAGQGVNLGLADAQALARIFREARAQQRDLGGARVLARYERARKADNLDMLAVTDGLQRVFALRTLTWDGLRGWGLHAVGRYAPLRQWLAQRAIGG